MAIQDKTTLKGYFNSGDIPTEENFSDLMDTVVLDPILASDKASGDIVSMTVDSNDVGIFAALHIDTTGGWIEANTSTVDTMPCQALALETGTGTKNVLLRGFARDDSWTWNTGAQIYVSTNGTLSETAPTTGGYQVQIVALAISSTEIYFNPSPILIEI